MSRIGKNPIILPENVDILLNNNTITVKGPRGELKFDFHKFVKVVNSDGQLVISRSSDNREHKALHGTTRQLINNMIIGVTEGFSKELEIIGVGYQAQMQGKRLHLQLGYSHDILFDLPDNINVETNRTEIKVEGIDKQLVGAVAAKIRSFRPPEPYKGKGVRYKNEYVRSKQGKTVGAK
jgi:large subunit ribosomal protein L6